MHATDDGFGFEDAVVEDVAGVGRMSEGKVLGIASTEKLQGHFHELFACELATREVVENELAVFRKEGDSGSDGLGVVAFELQPPVRFKFREGYPRLSDTPTQTRDGAHTHSLMVSPAEWPIWTERGGLNLELLVRFW